MGKFKANINPLNMLIYVDSKEFRGGSMKKVRNWRLTLGWQILIGLILGVVLGASFYHNQVAITVI